MEIDLRGVPDIFVNGIDSLEDEGTVVGYHVSLISCDLKALGSIPRGGKLRLSFFFGVYNRHTSFS
jgi:hypothetical protein